MLKPIKLRHKSTGNVKISYYGYSVNFLLFGFILPLIKGKIIAAIIHFFLIFFSFGIWQVVWSFNYNKYNIKRDIAKGWELDDKEHKNIQARLALGL